jgi:hypothetical protein
MAEFDAYLSGTLHYLAMLRTVAGGAEFAVPRRAATAVGMLLCAM